MEWVKKGVNYCKDYIIESSNHTKLSKDLKEICSSSNIKKGELLTSTIKLEFDATTNINELENILSSVDKTVEKYKPDNKTLENILKSFYVEEAWKNARRDYKAGRLFELIAAFGVGLTSWPASKKLGHVMHLQNPTILAITLQTVGIGYSIGTVFTSYIADRIDKGELKNYDLFARLGNLGYNVATASIAIAPFLYPILMPLISAFQGTAGRISGITDPKRIMQQSLKEDAFSQLFAQKFTQELIASSTGWGLGIAASVLFKDIGDYACLIGGGALAFSGGYLANRITRWHNPSAQDLEDLTYRLMLQEELPDVRTKYEKFLGLFLKKYKKIAKKIDIEKTQISSDLSLIEGKTITSNNFSLYSDFRHTAKPLLFFIGNAPEQLKLKDLVETYFRINSEFYCHNLIKDKIQNLENDAAEFLSKEAEIVAAGYSYYLSTKYDLDKIKRIMKETGINYEKLEQSALFETEEGRKNVERQTILTKAKKIEKDEIKERGVALYSRLYDKNQDFILGLTKASLDVETSGSFAYYNTILELLNTTKSKVEFHDRVKEFDKETLKKAFYHFPVLRLNLAVKELENYAIYLESTKDHKEALEKVINDYVIL